MAIPSKLRSRKIEQTPSLWKGPSVDGITYSLLCRFISCRERFRVHVVEGLAPNDSFNPPLEYGNLWHECEEAYHKGESIPAALDRWEKRMMAQYRTDQVKIRLWRLIGQNQHEVYRQFIEEGGLPPSTTGCSEVYAEEAFKVPLTLPSGRTVFLRGKWDSVMLSQERGIILVENKTKGDVESMEIERRLTFDLQTGIYLTALGLCTESVGGPLAKCHLEQICYNVVRRPLAGGRGTIRQKEANKTNPRGESQEEFVARLRADYFEEEPEYFFHGWEVPVDDATVNRFRKECLEPLLEQLCDWWGWITSEEGRRDPFSLAGGKGLHWRHPYNVYNVVDERGYSDLDNYLNDRSMAGLHRMKTLYPELEPQTEENVS